MQRARSKYLATSQQASYFLCKKEVRYLVTDVVSIPVIRLTSKTEAYRQSVKPGWSTAKWYSAADGYKNPVSRDHSDKTQQLVCDEDSGTDFYTKNGGYFRLPL
ncbi:hypothetical protein AALC17_14965 [Oscillospiraceae bacterium 38-13]